jgi:[pyruvate, water dikinase]-phosphate phosphotransferase / [pyruvate, water dikinase] kinase
MKAKAMKRPIFYVSDGTGITAETIGHSVLTQFDGVEFETCRLAFVDNVDKAQAAVTLLRQSQQSSGQRPIVINTVIDPDLSAILAGSGALMLDVFAPFIGPLETELGRARTPKVGRAHGLNNYAEYEARMHATNYALTHDDGVDVNFSDAEVTLIGVSRSGKTPTCLYLALHYGIRAANYPLIQEDLERGELPTRLKSQKGRIYGLSIDPNRLTQIRSERRPNSKYASLEQCRWEVDAAEKLFRREGVPSVSSTHTSIEEIASKVLQALGLNRQLY